MFTVRTPTLITSSQVRTTTRGLKIPSKHTTQGKNMSLTHHLHPHTHPAHHISYAPPPPPTSPNVFQTGTLFNTSLYHTYTSPRHATSPSPHPPSPLTSLRQGTLLTSHTHTRGVPGTTHLPPSLPPLLPPLKCPCPDTQAGRRECRVGGWEESRETSTSCQRLMEHWSIRTFQQPGNQIVRQVTSVEI